MIFNVPLQRKENRIQTTSCMADKVVELERDQYNEFSRNLLGDYDFIKENADQFYKTDDGINHGMLVLCKEHNDGIFVMTEGYDYARYSAFAPNARQMMGMAQHPLLTEFGNDMISVVDKYIADAIKSHHEGSYRILKDDIESTRYNEFNFSLFTDMLNERPEIEYAEDIDDEIFVTVSPEFINTEGEDNLRKLYDEDIEIMCAKHVLWLNDAGGEQADFSNCLLKNLNLSHKNLNAAIFDKAKIVNSKLDHAEFCSATFNGTRLYNCSAKGIMAEEAEFKEFYAYDCDFDRGYFTHNNLTGSVFRECSLNGSSLQSSCLEDVEFDRTDLSSADTKYCSHDEQDWIGKSGPVISM